MKTHQNVQAQEREDLHQERLDGKRTPERKQADLRIQQQRKLKVRYAN